MISKLPTPIDHSAWRLIGKIYADSALESGFDDPAMKLLPKPPVSAEYMTLLDQTELAMVENFPPVECPLIHTFTPGLYVRTIFMPKGALVTSRLHLTEHPFVVLSGVVGVRTEQDGWKIYRGGEQGITRAGTRRFLAILEDCRWATYHAISDEESGNVEAIENRILAKHKNPLLEKHKKEELK